MRSSNNTLMIDMTYYVKKERLVSEPTLSPDNNYECFISRGSAYGSEVLNTEAPMIIDIDYKYDSEQGMRVKENILKLKNRYNFRLYATKNGMRLIVSSTVIPTGSDEFRQLFMLFESDPLYEMLCIKQECYRARLTPKPCEIELPDINCSLDKSDNFYIGDSWVKYRLNEYYTKAQDYSVCNLLLETHECPEIETLKEIIKLHDDSVQIISEKPLG